MKEWLVKEALLAGGTVALLMATCGPASAQELTKAPPGKEANWMPTNPKGKFEVLFRLYGPEKPFFDKTWKLPDIERL